MYVMMYYVFSDKIIKTLLQINTTMKIRDLITSLAPNGWIPYTYLLTHLPTNTHYYGVRYKKGCHPKDFWIDYHTSSKYIADMINEYGLNSFTFQIRKIFTNSKEARRWESRVLKRMHAVTRTDFINRTDSDIIFFHDPEFKWYNDGTTNTLSAASPGTNWVIGRLRQKPTTAGQRTYNNGIIQVSRIDSPGEGWQLGMLPKRKVTYSAVKCPHCETVGKGSGMTRFHFDNCKGPSRKNKVTPHGQGRYQRLFASCIICHKETSINNIKRHHGNKCK